MRRFDDSQLVAETLPLAQLVLRLANQSRLFVVTLGQIGGVVTRRDIQKPPGRMWLFGMVTLIEMRFSRMIDKYCPNDAWQAFLSDGRIQKARDLLAERRRLAQQISLADCLQFADKVRIIASCESSEPHAFRVETTGREGGGDNWRFSATIWPMCKILSPAIGIPSWHSRSSLIQCWMVHG